MAQVQQIYASLFTHIDVATSLLFHRGGSKNARHSPSRLPRDISVEITRGYIFIASMHPHMRACYGRASHGRTSHGVHLTGVPLISVPLPPLLAASHHYLLPPITTCLPPITTAASHHYLPPPITTAASHHYLPPPTTTCCLPPLPATSHDCLVATEPDDCTKPW